MDTPTALALVHVRVGKALAAQIAEKDATLENSLIRTAELELMVTSMLQERASDKAFCEGVVANMKELQRERDSAMKVLARQIAVNEALTSVTQHQAALSEYIAWNGAMHREDCPADDTCECSYKWINDGIDALFKALADGPRTEAR